jgi:hypothetical protein
MRTARPGGPSGNGLKASKSQFDKSNIDASTSFSQDRPHFELPSSDRSLVRSLFWAMRREGLTLPAEPGVILIEGGRDG